MEKIIVNGIDISSLVFSFQSYEEMDKEHLIGNAVSTQIKLTLFNKDNQLKNIIDYPFIIGNKSYIVYEKPEKYTNIMSVTLYDYMLITNQRYLSELTYPTTITEQLDEMAILCGVNIDKSTLSSDALNKEVNWYDNTMLIRNYLAFIAQIDGKNAFIKNDVIVFRALAQVDHITQYCSNYELNEQLLFTRIAFDDGLNLIEKGNDEGKTLYLSSNNSYVTQDDVNRIYEMYYGLSFYSFKIFKCFGIDELSVTDTITYNDFTILPLSIKRIVNGGLAKDSLELAGDISIKNADSVIVKDDPNIKIKRIQTTINQNEAYLNIVAQTVDNQSDAIGELLISDEKIKSEVSKKVGDDEVISKINQSAEEIKIQASRLKLEGIITADGNVQILEDGSIVVNNGTFKGNIVGASFSSTKTSEYTYTEEDIDIMANLFLSEEEPTEEQLLRYDLNQNGRVDSNDALIIQKLLQGYYGETNGVATVVDYISMNVENNGKFVLERRLNDTTITRTEYNSGSINKVGGSITIDGEPVITSISGTVARWG